MKRIFRVLWVVVLLLLVVLGVGMVLAWAPDSAVETLKPRWAQAPSRFVEVSGMQVHVRDEGPRDDPHPVVLLHGTSDSLHTWEGWAQDLKGQRRVIRFDLPGFGLTGPNPKGDYSIAAYVQFVAAVMDVLGVQSFVLAGNSLGGQIAWGTALAWPQRVHRLVLVDAAGYPMQPQSIPLGFRLARIPALRGLMEHALPRFLVESSVRNVYGDPTKVTSALVDRYYELTLRSGNREALGLRLDQGFSGAQDRIKDLKIPTLILWGSRDYLIPLDNAKRFAADIAGSKLVIFEGLGHVPQEEDPRSTVLAVRDFLQM